MMIAMLRIALFASLVLGRALMSVKPGAQTGGDYDIARSRWYSISQGSIVCSELH
jgi:hypothetical protein